MLKTKIHVMNGWTTMADVQNRTGISSVMYQYYLSRGLIPRPTHRLTNGKRLYYTTAEADEIVRHLQSWTS